MLEALLLNILTAKILPVIIPPLVLAVRKMIHDRLPPTLIPIVLSLGSGLFNTIATWAGIEGVPADGAMLTAAAWEGLLVGAAAVGLHQVWRQAREWFRALKAKGKGKG